MSTRGNIITKPTDKVGSLIAFASLFLLVPQLSALLLIQKMMVASLHHRGRSAAVALAVVLLAV